MKGNWVWKLAASALASLTLLIPAALARVTVNGKPLDEIDDIMAETGVAREYPKQSLLIFRADKAARKYSGTVMALNGSGDVYATYSPSSQPKPAYFLPDWNGGLYPVSTAAGTDGQRRVWVPTAISGMLESPGFSFSGPVTSADWQGVCALKPGNDETIGGDGVTVTDTKAGFFPSGSGEIIVAALSKNIQTSSACTELVFLADGGDIKPSLMPLAHNIPGRDFHSDSAFPSCRVAVGDFDNDGRADELALLYNDESGSDRPYYIRVYKVSRDGSTLNAVQIGGDGDKGRLSSKANFHYRTEASAMLTGDFDGDGKEEFALVASDKKGDGNRTYISVEVFKWNGAGWNRGYKSASSDSHYQLANGGHGTEYRTWGLQAAAADLDGDGKDEIVTLAIHGQDYNMGTAFLSAWGCDKGTLTPKPLGYFDIDEAKLEIKKIDMEDNSDAAYWEQRLLSLAVGPFTGQVGGISSVRDVAFSMAGPKNPTDHGDASKQRVWVARTLLENGAFKGFDTPVMVFSSDVEGTVGLAAADFAAETLRLGTPEHVKVEGHKNYTVILKAPPYHVDWIQAPWQDTAPSGPTNFSWMGRTVQYETSEQEGTENLVTFKMQNCLEAGLNFKYDAELSVGLKGKAKDGGTGLASISAQYGFSVGFDGGLNFTNETANKNAATHTLSTQLKATTADALMYDAADYHIWRYPIEQPAPAWITSSFKKDPMLKDGNTSLDGNNFVTYTLCDEPTQHICDSASDQYDGYEPSYEEGNLFSYPNNVSYGMEEAQKELSSETSFALTTDAQQTMSFTKSGSSSEKDSTTCKLKVTGDLHGSISGGASIKVFSGKGSYSGKLYGQYGFEVGESKTSTKTWSNSEKVVIGASTDNLKNIIRDYVQFTTASQVFIDAAGVLTTPFGVTFGKNAWLWNKNYKESSQSPYVEKPDPALVLPGRYRQEKRMSDAGVVNTTWQAVADESAATRMRGMTIYDTVTQQYVSGVLEQGWKYTISFPIYNASFVDVPSDGVVVALCYQNRDGSGRKEIARKTVSLKGWTDDITNGGSNKAWVEFEWITDVEEGDYEFYVILDPDNAIPEVHETWTKDTRDGNNNGYRPFAVVNTSEETGAASLAAESESVSAGDFTLRFWDLNAEEPEMMTPPEFRSYVLAQSQDVHAGGQATYNGAPGVTNAEVELLCTDLAGGVTRVIFSRRFPVLRPGVTREFTFAADPEKLAEGKLAVRFSSSRGSFTVGENNGGGSSGGCNTLWGMGLGSLALAVMPLSYSKKGRKQ